MLTADQRPELILAYNPTNDHAQTDIHTASCPQIPSLTLNAVTYSIG